jgi:hypothetical protein
MLNFFHGHRFGNELNLDFFTLFEHTLRASRSTSVDIDLDSLRLL